MLLTLFTLILLVVATDAASHRSRHRVRRDTSEWSYVDCVNDGSARALTGYMVTDKANTVDKCLAACAGRGFVYAGLECESRA